MVRNHLLVCGLYIAVIACSLALRLSAQEPLAAPPNKTVVPKPHQRPSVPQEVFSPFWTVQPGWHTELMIRNNTSTEMSVLPVLRSRTGAETKLEPVTIPPNGSQSISVADALTRLAPSILSDADAYGSVVFRYNSVSAGHIYASVRVGRTGSPVMFHFDAAKSVPDFTSGSYQSIWWRPTKEDSGTLALANLADREIRGNIRLLDANGRSATHTFSIGGRQTQQISLAELLNKDGFEGEFGGVAIEPQNSPGYLQVLQFTLNETTGLGALLKVFPKSVLAEKQFTIRASMVALAHPDPALALPADTRLQPRIFLYNSTAHPMIAHVLVDWHSDAAWGRKPVPDLTIAPGGTQVLALGESDEQQLGIPPTATWGSVQVSYASDDGDLVAMEASPSVDGKYLVQTPFTDAQSSQFKGGEWMADGDHTALIIAGNGGTKPAKLDFKLWFGGATPYELPIKTLQPGEAITMNVGSIIANQQPDRNGKTIPLSVTSGTYEFSDLADPYVGYLYEGKQQIDKTYGLATYGCAFCCYYDYGWIADFTGHPGDSGPIPATGEKDCQSNYFDYDITSSVSGWASSNSNIATVSPDLAHAVSPGQAYSSGSASVRTYGSYKSCPLGLLAVAGLLTVHPTVSISGPTAVPLLAPGASGRNSIGLGATGTPPNGTYNWSLVSGSGIVTLSNTTSSTVTVTSQAVGTATLQATYTYNSQNATATWNVTVQKPTFLSIVPYSSVVAQENSCSPPINGCGTNRQFQYQVLDQSGQPIAAAGMQFWDQIFTTSPNTCSFTGYATTCSAYGIPNGGPCGPQTDSYGQFHETLTSCSTVCRSGSFCITGCSTGANQTWNVNGFSLTADVKALSYQCNYIYVNSN